MKVTNTGKAAHVLSHNGGDHFLAPGNFVEIDLTKAEADALPAPFVASGTPIKPAKVAVKEEGKKA